MPNLGLQVALQETPISNTQARLILACINTPPPSHSSMHHTATMVVDMTTTADEDYFKQIRENLKHVRGLADKAPINISLDADTTAIPSLQDTRWAKMLPRLFKLVLKTRLKASK